jgi:hypothetical protein
MSFTSLSSLQFRTGKLFKFSDLEGIAAQLLGPSAAIQINVSEPKPLFHLLKELHL